MIVLFRAELVTDLLLLDNAILPATPQSPGGFGKNAWAALNCVLRRPRYGLSAPLFPSTETVRRWGDVGPTLRQLEHAIDARGKSVEFDFFVLEYLCIFTIPGHICSHGGHKLWYAALVN